jgi:hypothetical protein
MKNWKTLVFGTIAGLPAILASLGITTAGKAQTVVQLIGGIGTLLFGLFAKDKNVTGAGPTAVAH